jgi:hypothetical protein
LSDAGGQHAAAALLRRAGSAQPTEQRLLIAAALREVMTRTPVVVGGAAEAYWAGDLYRPTDLDLCPRPTVADEAALTALGFQKEGRHWVHADLVYGVEFPGSGDDIQRTVEVSVGGAHAVVIAVEDLYLDRLRQSTMTERTRDRHFQDAVAIIVARRTALDWTYIDQRIEEEAATGQPLVGVAMQRMHPRVRAAARRALARIRRQELPEPRDPDHIA